MSASPAPAASDRPLRKRLRSSGPVSPPNYRPLRSWEVERQLRNHADVETVPPLLWESTSETKDGLSELEWMRLMYGPHLHVFTADMVEPFKNQPLFGIYTTPWNGPDQEVDPWPREEVSDWLIAVKITDGEGTTKHYSYPGALFQHRHVFGHAEMHATIHYPEPDHPGWDELYVVHRKGRGEIGVRLDGATFYVFAEKQ